MLSVDEILKIPGQQLPEDIERLQWLGSQVPPGGASHDYVDKPGHVFYFPGVLRTIAELIKPITDQHHECGYMWSGRKI